MTTPRRPSRRRTPGFARRVRADDGAITAFVAILSLALLAVTGLVLDGGLALSAKIDASDTAQDAARADAQALDLSGLRSGTVTLDPARGTRAAQASLAASGYTGTVTVTGRRVTVHVTHEQRTQLLSLVGVGSLTVTATASAEAQRGVTTPDPLGGAP